MPNNMLRRLSLDLRVCEITPDCPSHNRDLCHRLLFQPSHNLISQLQRTQYPRTINILLRNCWTTSTLTHP